MRVISPSTNKDKGLKPLFFFFFLIILTPFASADSNWVRAIPSYDSVYCLLTGCTINGDLDINGNLTVTGDVVNITVTDYNVTNDLTVDTDTLFVDSTNDRVGIGTDIPDVKLHTFGDLRLESDGSSVTFSLHPGGSQKGYLQASSSTLVFGGTNPFQIRSSANTKPIFFTTYDGGWFDRMTISKEGNVGIGTNSPLYNFEIENSGNNLFKVRDTGSGVRIGIGKQPTGNAISLGAYSDRIISGVSRLNFASGLNKVRETNNRMIFDSSNGWYFWPTGQNPGGDPYGMVVRHLRGDGNTTDNIFLAEQNDGTDVFNIKADGKVGIGTTGPDEKLVVEDNDLAVQLLINNDRVGNGDALIGFQTDATTQMVICFDDSVNRLEFIVGDDCDDSPQAYFDIYGLHLYKGSLNYGKDNLNIGDTTPSVAYGSFFTVRNYVTTVITNLDMGREGQIVYIVCMDSLTRLSDSGDLKLSGTFYCGNYDSITLIYDGRSWIELARSDN